MNVTMTPEELFQKGLEAYRKEGCEVACSYFRQAAEQGYAPAQHELATCYYNGKGVEYNVSLSFMWDMKAAEQGFEDAEYEIGYNYQNGEGVVENNYKAIMWFRKAAEKGHSEAQYEMGVYYTDCACYETAFNWFKKSADQGHLNGAYQTAISYKKGKGTEQNYEESMKYFMIVASSKGDPFDYPIEESMREIGWLYFYGQGVEKDEHKALVWFKKSVEQIRHYPKRQEWYEKVESFVCKSGDRTIWDHLKKFIDEKGNIIK